MGGSVRTASSTGHSRLSHGPLARDERARLRVGVADLGGARIVSGWSFDRAGSSFRGVVAEARRPNSALDPSPTTPASAVAGSVVRQLDWFVATSEEPRDGERDSPTGGSWRDAR
jgi:hypothetical protein